MSIRDLICIEPDIELGVDVFLSFIANYYLRPFEISSLFFLIAIFFEILNVLLILLQLQNVSITFISSRRHIFSTLIQSTHFKIFNLLSQQPNYLLNSRAITNIVIPTRWRS